MKKEMDQVEHTMQLYDQDQGFADRRVDPAQGETVLLDPEQESDGETVLLPEVSGDGVYPYLRLIGNPALPPRIEIALQLGQMFTIGRFDASIGIQQSSFEFDKRTIAVSRHHAVISHTAEGYFIQDLGSKAGTFVDGEKLDPGTKVLLRSGTHVSFGNGGANYMWMMGSEV